MTIIFEFKEKESRSNIHMHIPKFIQHLKDMLIDKGMDKRVISNLSNVSVIKRCLKEGIIIQQQVSELGRYEPYMEYELYQDGGYYKFHRSYITKSVIVTSHINEIEVFDY